MAFHQTVQAYPTDFDMDWLRLSAADKAALKEKTAECTKEAKDQKLGWLARRKFVKSCVAK